MIKKSKLKMLLYLIPLFLLFVLYGCFNTSYVESIEVIGPTDDVVYKIRAFKYEDYNVVVTYQKGNQETIPLTEDMINEHDRLLFYKEGTHTITVTYMKKSTTFDVELELNDFSDDILFESLDVEYDGLPHKVEVVGNLPEGTIIYYKQGNEFTDCSYHDLEAYIVCEGYNVKIMQAHLSITKATYNLDHLKFNDEICDYTGAEIDHKIEGELPDGLSVSYQTTNLDTEETIVGSKVLNAGNYKIVASFTNHNGNYYDVNPITSYLTVEKANYDLSNCLFLDDTIIYDGSNHKIELRNKDGMENFLKDIRISYLYNGVEAKDGVKEAGVYNVDVLFESINPNFTVIDKMTAILTINRQVIKTDGVIFDSKSFVYEKDTKRSIFCSADSENVSQAEFIMAPENSTFIGYKTDLSKDTIYESLEFSDVGKYTVYAIFEPNDTNHVVAGNGYVSAILEIKPQDVNILVNVTANNFSYDGLEHELAFTFDNLDGIIKCDYEKEKYVDAGEYLVNLTFSTDSPNYNIKNDELIIPVIVSKQEVLVNVTVLKNEFKYDGNAHDLSFDYTQPIEGIEYTVVGNGQTEVGKYNVKIIFTSTNPNYQIINSEQSFILTINSAE